MAIGNLLTCLGEKNKLEAELIRWTFNNDLFVTSQFINNDGGVSIHTGNWREQMKWRGRRQL